MILAPGDAFQALGEGYHLKVVVTFPNANGDVVVFALTDAVNIEEQICIFEKGEHRFFDKPRTAVDFRRKLIVPATGFREDLLCFHDRFSLEQVVKMIDAARLSECIQPVVLKELPKIGAEMKSFCSRF